MEQTSEPAAPRRRQARRARRDARVQRRNDWPDADRLGRALKERIYASFTGLAIVLALRTGVEHTSARSATSTLFIGVVGICLAGLLAEIVAHLAAHGAGPGPDELRMMVRIAGGALGSASLPVLLLALAWADRIELDRALRVSTVLYLVTLGAIGYAAARRTGLIWWKQLVVLAGFVVLGAAVVAVQVAAHGL